nr:formin-like protein 3 [Lolium perenne]
MPTNQHRVAAPKTMPPSRSRTFVRTAAPRQTCNRPAKVLKELNIAAALRDDCIASTTRRIWRGRSGHPPPATRRIPEAHLTSKHPAVQRTRVVAARCRARQTSLLILNARHEENLLFPTSNLRLQGLEQSSNRRHHPRPSAAKPSTQPPSTTPPPPVLATTPPRPHASPTPPLDERQPAPSPPSEGRGSPAAADADRASPVGAPRRRRGGGGGGGRGLPAARVPPRSLAGATREGIRD